MRNSSSRSILFRSIIAVLEAAVTVASWIPPVPTFLTQFIPQEYYWVVNVGLFLIFCGIIVWIIFGLRGEIRTLSNEKPNIAVFHAQEFDKLYLNVLNTGEKGYFKCHIAIVSSNVICQEMLRGYRGLWQNTQSDHNTILRDESASIHIATINPKSTKRKISFHGFRMGTKAILYASECEENGNKVDNPQYRIQVTISSDPGLLTEFRRFYDITTNGIFESKKQPTKQRIARVVKRDNEAIYITDVNSNEL